MTTHRTAKRLAFGSVIALLALTFLGTSIPTQAAPAAADNCQTFNETGFTVCGRFLEYWNANGGLAQ